MSIQNVFILNFAQGFPMQHVALKARPEARAGSGKSALAAELARATGNAGGLIRVHVDDQMDAKALLGAYVCTAVPSEFAWQPGPLTQVRVTCGQCQLLVIQILLCPQLKTNFLLQEVRQRSRTCSDNMS